MSKIKTWPQFFEYNECKRIVNNLTSNITGITSLLIGEESICVDQNFTKQIERNDKFIVCPSIHAGEGEISSHKGIFDKGKKYHELYSELHKNRNFTIELLDGAIITFYYEFKFCKDEKRGKKTCYLSKHRLSFFPSTEILDYDQDETLFENEDIFIDMISANIYPSPIRLDYDFEASKDIDHPQSHLTLGQYMNCRIPVSAPLTPVQFISFILKNFYYNFYCSNKIENKLNKIEPKFKPFSNTITSSEERITHIIVK